MDHQQIEEFIAVLRDSGLAEIEVRQGNAALRLRRASRRTSPAPTRQAVAAAAVAAETASGATEEPPAAPFLPLRVTAALVGIFHGPRQPFAVGDRVAEQQILGHIESMRLMNECFAPAAGRIAAVLVEDGQPVEYGQALFEIDVEAEGAES